MNNLQQFESNREYGRIEHTAYTQHPFPGEVAVPEMNFISSRD